MKSLIQSILVGVLSFPLPAVACSLAFEPLDRPSRQELVFIGKVSIAKDAGPTAVLHFDDVQVISGPATETDFRVQVWQLMANCSEARTAPSELLAIYPVETAVVVVAEVEETRQGRVFRVLLGGNSRIDPKAEPSDGSRVRVALAKLETSRDERERAQVLRGVITERSGALDIGGAIRRYLSAGALREKMLQECRAYWGQWPDLGRCE